MSFFIVFLGLPVRHLFFNTYHILIKKKKALMNEYLVIIDLGYIGSTVTKAPLFVAVGSSGALKKDLGPEEIII